MQGRRLVDKIFACVNKEILSRLPAAVNFNHANKFYLLEIPLVGLFRVFKITTVGKEPIIFSQMETFPCFPGFQ